MITRKERRDDRQDRRQGRDRKEAGKGPNFSIGKGLNKLANSVVDTASNVVGAVDNAINPTPTVTTTTTTPTTPPPVVEDEPVVDPITLELNRQGREVALGNVNAAQAEYFKQQNKENRNPDSIITPLDGRLYNKIEKMTGVNPVSNREDKMTKLFGGLYGSDESRGIL
jgi:hypothetical protein